MATISPPFPDLAPSPPLPPFATADLGVTAALVLEGVLAAGRRLAGSTAARLGLGDRFKAGTLGVAQSRRLLGMLRIEGEARFRGLAGRLVGKEIGLASWASAMRGGVERLVAAGFHAIARGKPLTDAMKAAFVAARATQLGYLEGFRAAIAKGVQILDGRVVSRAALYAAATWGAAVNGQRDAMRRLYAEELRVLGNLDHCNTCLSEAALRWQPAGTLRAIGDSECRARCGCHFIYRTHDGRVVVP